ncbi:hypothetical protein AX17_005777 [Amanita inopinata Kibby_2008]|nr:hypothetical protein AX17_005777 [Amanita inopinata Kibby_2008]
MALKRKFDIDYDGVQYNCQKAKQLKLVPFPNMDSDNDVAMSEAEPYFPELHHIRTPSSASSTSSFLESPIIETSVYPTFDLYPLPFFSDEGSVNTDSHNFSHYASQHADIKIGLLQPSASFRHHGTSCSQIPKLRVACASGPNGQRTMWSLCEQCGSISMVDAD